MIRIQLPLAEVERLEELFRSTQDRKLRDRLQIVLMAHRGRPRQEIATDPGINRVSVTRWLNAWCERGLDGLRPGRPRAPHPAFPPRWAGRKRRFAPPPSDGMAPPRPRSEHGCRAGGPERAALERIPYVIRQWLVEIRPYRDLTGQQAQGTRRGSPGQGHKACQRTARLGDDDFLTPRGAFHETGEVGLGFVQVDGCHGGPLTKVDQDMEGGGSRSRKGEWHVSETQADGDFTAVPPDAGIHHGMRRDAREFPLYVANA